MAGNVDGALLDPASGRAHRRRVWCQGSRRPRGRSHRGEQPEPATPCRAAPPVCPVPNSDAVRNHSLTSAARRNRARHLGLSFPKRYINEAPRRAKNWRSKRPCPTRLRRRWRVDPKSIFASTVDSRTSFGCHAWAWSATGLFARSPRFRNKASIALAAVKQKSLLFLLLQSN
jgi:hypothetical protein